jgi:hypothetical protein
MDRLCGQSSWLQILRSRARFPALPDFLSSGSGTGSTQPRLENWGAAPVLKTDINDRRDPLRWLRDTLYRQKVGTNFADKQRSLGRYSSHAN